MKYMENTVSGRYGKPSGPVGTRKCNKLPDGTELPQIMMVKQKRDQEWRQLEVFYYHYTDKDTPFMVKLPSGTYVRFSDAVLESRLPSNLGEL